MNEIGIGSKPASARTVLEYLTHQEGGNLSDLEARELINSNAAILDNGVTMRSYAYYVGDEMLKARKK
jgi:hypothetical protein